MEQAQELQRIAKDAATLVEQKPLDRTADTGGAAASHEPMPEAHAKAKANAKSRPRREPTLEPEPALINIRRCRRSYAC